MAGGAGGRDPLVASEIHGFLTCADLNFDKLMMEAGTRWFRPNEIYAVLANYARLKIHAQPIDKPISGTVVLYDRKVVRNFRKDGHNWKKKKDGKTVQEAHEKLKIGNEEKVHVYYARGEDDPNFFRRCYWLLDKVLERIVLVHYRQTSEENALPPPHAEDEVAEVPPINMVHYGPPLTSTDSASAHTELSSAAADINSNGGWAISSEADDHGSSLESFWADLLESSMKNDSPVGASSCGRSLASNHQTNNGTRDSGNNILHANATSNGIFSPTTNVVSEFYANPGHTQASESYFGSLKHQEDLDSKSKQHANSLMKAPVYGNMPNDVPSRQNSLGLWKYLDDDISLENNPSSSIRPTEQETDERSFHITEMSSEWAYCTEDTKVLVVGYFHENYKHLAGTNLFCVIGDQCVVANIVQTGVYRIIVRPHVPGQVSLYLTLDGKTPISEVLSFDYRMAPDSQSLADDEPQKSKLQTQMRLARLLITTNKKKMAPKLLVEGSKVSNLLSVSIEEEWMDLLEFVMDSKGTYVSAIEGLLELVVRNRLQVWLVEKVIEGQKSTDRDDLGQGPIHLCSFLGYTWAIRLFSLSGLSMDFRDSSGWTALHWAANYGREKMVAALMSAGANPTLVTDPTHDAPGGYTAADLAARQGYNGLAGYLAEKGLTAHFEAMSLSKDKRSTSRTKSLKQNTMEFENLSACRGSCPSSFIKKKFENLSEQELKLRESLEAYRNAAEAAANIHAALRKRALKLLTKAIQLDNPEIEAASTVAAMPCLESVELSVHVSGHYLQILDKNYSRVAPEIMSLELLKKITKNFSEKRELGRGTFGTVYQGVHNGKEIAVKLLRPTLPSGNDEEFRNEYENLRRLNHPNIVQLLGYCYEIKCEFVHYGGRSVLADNIYRALCFDYMCNGSLQGHLNDEFHGLEWQTRYKIIKGTCKGLKYLHEGLETPMYHLDLKPGNILLDNNMMPKLADFGLSKLVSDNHTQATSSILGTIRYCPPEYIEKKFFSNKFDIFSLGVVMIEIIVGSEGYLKIAEMTSKEDIIHHVQENWRKRLQATPGCTSLIYDCHQVKRCIEIALDCVSPDRTQRPDIGKIISLLNETENYSE